MRRQASNRRGSDRGEGQHATRSHNQKPPSTMQRNMMGKDMADNPDSTGRNQDGTFVKGVSGNPSGRPKGSRHILQEQFFRALQKDFEENGDVVLQVMRAEKPNEYARMIAGLMTKEFEGSVSGDMSPALKAWLGLDS